MTQKIYCHNRNFHGRVGGFLSAVALCIVALLAGIPAVSQVQTGIIGTVADSAGAVIQYAKVTVANAFSVSN